jgi:hypothetical protein
MPRFSAGDFEIPYPEVSSNREREPAQQYLAGDKAIAKRGPVDTQALVAGKLPPVTSDLEDGATRSLRSKRAR